MTYMSIVARLKPDLQVSSLPVLKTKQANEGRSYIVQSITFT